KEIDDPYGYASATELSLFRRPLTMANVRFFTTIMWDGRFATLEQQAADAIMSHGRPTDMPAPAFLARIVKEENVNYFAQYLDNMAGVLNEGGARGGPANIVQLAFQRRDKGRSALFDAWLAEAGNEPKSAARRAVARGEVLFNERKFSIA